LYNIIQYNIHYNIQYNSTNSSIINCYRSTKSGIPMFVTVE